MAENVRIRHKDGNLRALEKALRDVGKVSIKVGFQGKSGLERAKRRTSKRRHKVGKIRMVDLAAIHHLGAPRAGIPRRPFMGVMGDKKVFVGIARRVARAAVRGESVDKALLRGGKRLVSLIRKRIVDLQSPPLAQSTKDARLRRRGDTTPNPLVDTGGMVRAVSAIAERNGRVVAVTERKARTKGRAKRRKRPKK